MPSSTPRAIGGGASRSRQSPHRRWVGFSKGHASPGARDIRRLQKAVVPLILAGSFRKVRWASMTPRTEWSPKRSLRALANRGKSAALRDAAGQAPRTVYALFAPEVAVDGEHLSSVSTFPSQRAFASPAVLQCDDVSRRRPPRQIAEQSGGRPSSAEPSGKVERARQRGQQPRLASDLGQIHRRRRNRWPWQPGQPRRVLGQPVRRPSCGIAEEVCVVIRGIRRIGVCSDLPCSLVLAPAFPAMMRRAPRSRAPAESARCTRWYAPGE